MSTPAADARSPHARQLVSDLLDIAPAERRLLYRELSPREMKAMLTASRHELGSTYGLWQDDPVGFVEDVCGDTTWSKQRELLESVRDNSRTSCVSTHSASKTFSGGRLVAWYIAVHPVGTAMCVTTAPTFRQVKSQMWPGIAAAHAAAGLPGKIDTAQWKIGRHVVAYGFTVGENNEAALQGIKANKLLIVVDEAGGISHTIGKAFVSLMSQPDVHMVILGNAPTDEEGTWYEEQSEKAEQLVTTIRIPASATPNFTGELTGRCTTCPAVVPPHRIALHLTQPSWVDDVVTEFGEESAYVQARVHALFVRAVGQKVMPLSWVEAATDSDHVVPDSTWCRLGADIASDGGDEFAIARAVGNVVDIVHRSSGAANADPVNVSGVIQAQIRELLDVRDRVGDKRPVHVKIDASGLGWAVAGFVKRWCAEQKLDVRVYGVRAEAKPHDVGRFHNIRSEMWWHTRKLMQPATDPSSGQVIAAGSIKLRNAPTRLVAQLSAPKYASDSSGKIVVEKKKDTKKRVGGSPDLADAVNLCLYEPPGEGEASIESNAVVIPTGPPRSSGAPAPVGDSSGVVIPLGPRSST